MPTVDTFGGGSDAPTPFDTGGTASSDAVAPYTVSNGTFDNVSPNVLPEVILISLSPSSGTAFNVLIITGTELHRVHRVVMDGLSAQFTFVNKTRIDAVVPLILGVGVKSVYAEFV